jgi:hypothetical protein
MLDLSNDKNKELHDIVSKFIVKNTDLKFLCSHEANTNSKGVYRLSFFVGTPEYMQNPNLDYIEELKNYYEGRPGWEL